jgi:hypothetical protein
MGRDVRPNVGFSIEVMHKMMAYFENGLVVAENLFDGSFLGDDLLK